VNEKLQEMIHSIATESGITDMVAAEKFAMIFGQRLMGFDYPFICGGSEEKDHMGLPKTITVCPAYGLDGFAIYEKKGEYSAPGW
jgi:hypothetical protein